MARLRRSINILSIYNVDCNTNLSPLRLLILYWVGVKQVEGKTINIDVQTNTICAIESRVIGEESVLCCCPGLSLFASCIPDDLFFIMMCLWQHQFPFPVLFYSLVLLFIPIEGLNFFRFIFLIFNLKRL
jgi:hypothetical protein